MSEQQTAGVAIDQAMPGIGAVAAAVRAES